VIEPTTRKFVVDRAGNRCEYCRIVQSGYIARFHVDHVIPKQHGGKDEPENLAFCCPACNRKKGPNLSGVDPETASIVTIFNPRQQSWSEHFRWSGVSIVGVTPHGRATVQVLELNAAKRLKLRRALLAEGVLPPP
jgi:hypothetical protein